VEIVLGKIAKHPANPLFGEDKPWEQRFDNFYGSIIYDEDKMSGIVDRFGPSNLTCILVRRSKKHEAPGEQNRNCCPFDTHSTHSFIS
jgi:hypothetical protein